MIIKHKVDNNNLLNHYFILEHFGIFYIRRLNKKSGKVVWEYGLNPDITYPDEMNIDKLEKVFNRAYRKDKINRLMEDEK